MSKIRDIPRASPKAQLVKSLPAMQESEMKSLSHVRLLATPWTAAHQAPPSKGFSRQEYWNGVPSPSMIFLAKYG